MDSMLLKHVALVCSSEKRADRFYRDLLGLKKSEPRQLPAALARATFDLETDLLIINYRGDNLHFEVFIAGRIENVAAPINHVCLEVDNLQNFIKKGHDLGVAISQIPKGDYTLTFIRDFDGNLFEIKHTAP
jgi:catechol 2,3-dioxygenase-like lactoylglutathione lyase family enzyme